MLHVDVDDLGERGVAELMAVGEFMLVKPLVVMGLHKLDDIMVGLTGLDDDNDDGMTVNDDISKTGAGV